ncbi:GlxA family transcriptional regulator [Ningiella sp. W23]|uniref:GlxA family transcriptional regulator n=1 Tax=Ningiella sp. W23 TaxID=3023715 RepID=UPI0037573E59
MAQKDMSSPPQKDIVFYIFDDFELLDLAGVSAVFDAANRCAATSLYNISIYSQNEGLVSSSSSTQIYAQSPPKNMIEPVSTFIVVGGQQSAITGALSHPKTLEHVRMFAASSVRVCSVCTGAFLLAEAGLLNHKSATTHFDGIEQLINRYPKVKVREDVLFTEDKGVFTSAGVSTGIDLALELVSIDNGIAVSNQTAKRLVVNMHRPSSARQTAHTLLQQRDTSGAFIDLHAWLMQSIHKQICVDEMADYVNMSPRSFSRKFNHHHGLSPHKYFSMLKVEHAKMMLARGYRLNQVCEATGYESSHGLNKLFKVFEGMTVFQYHKAMQAKSRKTLPNMQASAS